MHTKEPSSSQGESRAGTMLTFGIVTVGSILFCSKGVFAKLSYAHGLDPISVLNLRMLFSLPFFVAIVLVVARGIPRLPLRDWGRLVGLGFLGYYLSSWVNFSGLQYISVGLERVILFTYPALVLLLGALVLRRKVSARCWVAAGLAWAGILVAFGGEARVPVPNGNVPLGASLVLLSAFTYAVFILVSGDTIKRVGPLLFGGIAVGISCVFMLAHFVLVHSPSDVFHYSRPVYGHAMVLAVFGTVAPALLMSVGLKRAGPQRFAVMGALGPVATLFLAWTFLGERPGLLQGIGLVLALAGGIVIAYRKSETEQSPPRQ